MAKTTPSRAKSKTKAPKKKPTQLDRIERSIGLIESKLATLNAWEMLNEAMSEAKLASPTVAVEEKWVPKVGEWVVSSGNRTLGFNGWSIQEGDVRKVEHVSSGLMRVSGDPYRWGVDSFRPATPEEIKPKELKVGDWVVRECEVSRFHGMMGRIQGLHGRTFLAECSGESDYWDQDACRPATSEEIAAHEAKLKAEAQAAEDAKLVFGARVRYDGGEARLACDRPDCSGSYLLSDHKYGSLKAVWRNREDFTLLP